MSYSGSGGGTLTLPSPTHVHHVDVTSAVRSLRRSLSRSPSKFRLIAHRSESPSSRSPLSPSPASPQKRASSQSLASAFNTPTHTTSPLAKPFPPSVKLSLRSATRSKTTTPRATSRTRTSPKSPMKRALSVVSDGGNSARGAEQLVEQEGKKSGSISPPNRRSLEKYPRERLHPSAAEVNAPLNHALSRLGGDGCSDMPSTSSPLKRSDAIMNLDQASLGSPVAKRRSLHGSTSFGHDFNVFDHGPTSSPQFDIHDDSTQEYELSANSISMDHNSLLPISSMPRRSSSLRKSTLQQRHGEKKTSWGRRHAAALELASASAEVSTPVAARSRPRMSLDQFLPPLARDSPFASQGNLPNASMHMMHPNQQAHQPHPLSRTMTTSSSNSSLAEDSPTHVPIHFGEQPRPRLDFSKSMPAGSLRPLALDTVVRAEHSMGTFSTPDNYKTVKPLPAAFMSTGLVSKVNRNPEEPQFGRGVTKSNMPDTPCKKPINGFATYPAQMPGSAIAKARHIRHSFGTPSTPFNPNGRQSSQSIFGAGVNVFGSAFGGSHRRGSFLSVDGEDCGNSPEAKGGYQSSTDYDLPPTPTKQVMEQLHNGSPQSLRVPVSAIGLGISRKVPRSSSKLNFSTSLDDEESEESDLSMDFGDSPTTAGCHLSVARPTLSSFSRSRALRSSNAFLPAALNTNSPFKSSIYPHSMANIAKIGPTPASPLESLDLTRSLSPQTPRDSFFPPDPSGLSISNHRDGNLSRVSLSANPSMLPPATPTAGRDYFAQFNDRRMSTTPVNGHNPMDIDEALTSRFEKIELIGTGEFSQVYRVTKAVYNSGALQSFFNGASEAPELSISPPSLVSNRIYAVKKARQPFTGIRDRKRKLQEVEVLKALGHSDHVVHFIDNWEQKDYLYIQTEFCEEGSLDLFLSQVGRKGRLDDFRIWKIMLELSEGIKHIHDSGYIHLDLKPANILITFEGVLKIADFGMATAWPALPGVEAEGDREYIGPEILQGRYDKPADIFALGLIMLEIAGNVQLPDNGPTWQRLRSGDMSDVPSLTFSNSSGVTRDATGFPVEDSDTSMESFSDDDQIGFDFGSPSKSAGRRHTKKSSSSLSHDAGNLFGSLRRGELHAAPAFMKDSHHDHALDSVVRWMINPTPEFRPTVHEVLQSEGLQWVNVRRRAGATVFEGNWGPADAVLADDAEMLDV